MEGQEKAAGKETKNERKIRFLICCENLLLTRRIVSQSRVQRFLHLFFSIIVTAVTTGVKVTR